MTGEVACPRCTLLNPISISRCSACDSNLIVSSSAPPIPPRPKPPVKPGKVGWKCHHCGSDENPHPAALSCSLCLAKRKVPSFRLLKRLNKVSFKFWDCSACTLHNEIGKPECGACGEKNPTRSTTLPPINAPINTPARPPQPSVSSMSSHGWLCSRCSQAHRTLPTIDKTARFQLSTVICLSTFHLSNNPSSSLLSLQQSRHSLRSLRDSERSDKDERENKCGTADVASSSDGGQRGSTTQRRGKGCRDLESHRPCMQGISTSISSHQSLIGISC